MTLTQITECTDERQLCEWAAVYCMGWQTSEAFDDVYIVKESGSTHYLPKSRYQPTSPTEKGKSQCWDLAVKYGLQIGFILDDEVPYVNYRLKESESGKGLYFDGEYWCGHVKHENPQIAVVKAAILSALNGEE